MTQSGPLFKSASESTIIIAQSMRHLSHAYKEVSQQLPEYNLQTELSDEPKTI